MQSRTMDKRVKKDKCILVAGMPWAGKTTFVSEIKKRFKDLFFHKHTFIIQSIILFCYNSKSKKNITWNFNSKDYHAHHNKDWFIWLQIEKSEVWWLCYSTPKERKLCKKL